MLCISEVWILHVGQGINTVATDHLIQTRTRKVQGMFSSVPVLTCSGVQQATMRIQPQPKMQFESLLSSTRWFARKPDLKWTKRCPIMRSKWLKHFQTYSHRLKDMGHLTSHRINWFPWVFHNAISLPTTLRKTSHPQPGLRSLPLSLSEA